MPSGWAASSCCCWRCRCGCCSRRAATAGLPMCHLLPTRPMRNRRWCQLEGARAVGGDFSIDPDLLSLTDAVALVTGAGHGIARGCALQLAKAGCHVAIVDVDREAGQAVAKEVEALGRRAVYINADVLDPAGVARMVRETIDALGSLDVACNVVGNPGHPAMPLLDLDLPTWNATVHRNLGSAFLGTQAEALAMIERRIPGRIINVASSSGLVGAPNVADYGAANAGVIHFCKSAAMELARYGIRVNCIVPGTQRRDPAAGGP